MFSHEIEKSLRILERIAVALEQMAATHAEHVKGMAPPPGMVGAVESLLGNMNASILADMAKEAAAEPPATPRRKRKVSQ